MPIQHEPNKNWTIEIKHEGMIFFITNIVFANIASAAAKGIKENIKGAETKIYFAQNQIQED